MMRTSGMLRASVLVTPQLPKASAATGMQLVNRILGRTNNSVTCAKAFGEIAEKATQGKTAVYAYLGRAMVFLNRGEDRLALLDVDNASKAAQGAEGRGLIASLRFQCAVRLLVEERRKLTISGATTEMQVSTKVEAVKAALNELTAAYGRDYAVALAKAEFYLTYAHDAATAATHFAEAVDLASSESQAGVGATGAAEAEAVAAAAVDASTVEIPTDFKSKNVSTKAISADAQALETLRGLFDTQGLTDQQITLLGSVLACETRGGPVLDAALTPTTEPFSPWTSTKAQSVVRRLGQVSHPFVPQPHAHIAKPANPFFKEGVKAADLVKECPADKHILDYVTEKHGQVPRSQLAAEDAEFFKALNEIKEHSHEVVPAGGAKATADYYSTLAKDLMQQVIARAKVGQAEALTQLGQHEEAERLLKAVEQQDAYIDMWRLLQAKGTLMRKTGRVDAADGAFKLMHALRQQAQGTDLPLIDENRYKSAF
jgi:hypothetical protein